MAGKQALIRAGDKSSHPGTDSRLRLFTADYSSQSVTGGLQKRMDHDQYVPFPVQDLYE